MSSNNMLTDNSEMPLDQTWKTCLKPDFGQVYNNSMDMVSNCFVGDQVHEQVTNNFNLMEFGHNNVP